jgi:DDE family transposase
MSHQDQTIPTEPAAHHQDLKAVLDWLLAGADLSGARFRDLCTWTPRGLTCAALLWAWSGEAALTARFTWARKIAVVALGLSALTAATYQAFLKMLRAWTVVLAAALATALRRRMQEDLAGRFLVGRYALFGVDGSRLELPRTASNEAHFAPAPGRRLKPKRRQARTKAARTKAARTKAARAKAARATKANSPQMWLTTMWHVGTGLPWDWRLGPSDSSERDHLKQMIAALPAHALVTADAGFVGYEYWKALLDSGRHLLIRVGANVRLLRGLGYARERAGRVYLWPDREAARRQPPLVLRLVVAHGGRHPVYLVTSVLDEEDLSDKQIIEMYALRWGIEVFYRHFKQTFGRRKLRSHRGENAEVEATWSLLGLWSLGLHAQVELARDGIPARRVSVAGLLHAYRASMQEYRSRPDPGESLWERLSEAVIDAYQRSNKASRDYPRKKHAHAIGAPEIRPATKVEIEIARQIKDNHPTRLTA